MQPSVKGNSLCWARKIFSCFFEISLVDIMSGWRFNILVKLHIIRVGEINYQRVKLWLRHNHNNLNNSLAISFWLCFCPRNSCAFLFSGKAERKTVTTHFAHFIVWQAFPLPFAILTWQSMHEIKSFGHGAHSYGASWAFDGESPRKWVNSWAFTQKDSICHQLHGMDDVLQQFKTQNMQSTLRRQCWSEIVKFDILDIIENQPVCIARIKMYKRRPALEAHEAIINLSRREFMFFRFRLNGKSASCICGCEYSAK